MREKKFKTIDNVLVTSISGEGKGIARIEGKVYFIEKAVPGDVVNIQIRRSKSSYAEASVLDFIEKSGDRITPSCEHFGICGGCKWQFLSYEKQLEYKQKHINDSFEKIGKVQVNQFYPILGSNPVFGYRNKMEYSFTDRKWLTNEEVASGNEFDRRGLGFHVPENFLGVLDINKCWLQTSLGDEIRLFVKQLALDNNLTFFNLKHQTGFLRNLMIRTAYSGETLVLLSFAEPDEKCIKLVLDAVATKFPQINSLQYVVNQKRNDTIYDQDVYTFKGNDYIIEQLGDYKFCVRAKSFFQTNTKQAKELYDITKSFADLTGNELVYDLYTGVGSIAIYIASQAKHVVGVEQIEDAIRDAKENAAMNNITNCSFFVGDVRMTLQQDFEQQNGKPDVIITDPPRAGMHEDVVKTIIDLSPKRVVYVSCNPATQARDLQILSDHFSVEKSRAVDMFPHTTHVENVVQLVKR